MKGTLIIAEWVTQNDRCGEPGGGSWRSHMIGGAMDLERISQYLFILYCTTIGVALLFIPWSPGWETLVLHLPFSALRWLAAPAARGAVSGFGLVHLVWSAYELREFLRPTSAGEPPEP